jgi:hypothetical protein
MWNEELYDIYCTLNYVNFVCCAINNLCARSCTSVEVVPAVPLICDLL